MVTCCLEHGYRKCLNLHFWQLTDACDSFDNYGNGVEGIINFLKEKGIGIKAKNDIAVVDEHCRLYIYDYDINAILSKLEAFRKHMPIYNQCPYAIVMMNAAAATPEVFNAVATVASRNFYALPGAVERLERDPLELEAEAKELLASGRNLEAMSAMVAMMARVARWMEKEEAAKVVRLWLEDSLPGIALSVLHDVALRAKVIAEAGEELRPDDADRVEEVVRNAGVENKLSRLLMFATEYLRAAKGLADVMSSDDYSNIVVRIVDSSLWMRLGAHHAKVTVSGAMFVIEYSDHDEERARAFGEFMKRIGFDVKIDGGDVTIRVPWERRSEAAMALAATTSVDIQRMTWIFERANSIEELLELRRQVPEDEPEEDWDDEEDYDEEDEDYEEW